MSEIQVPEKFLKPFYKFHLSQINRAFKSSSQDWKVPVGDRDSGDCVSCHMVWVQGKVKSLNTSEDTLVLTEETVGEGHRGIISVLKNSLYPKFCGV